MNGAKRSAEAVVYWILGSCFVHPAFLLGHSFVQVTSTPSLLFLLPRSSSSLVHVPSLLLLPSFMLHRCCFFFVPVLHCFHSCSVHWRISLLLRGKLFPLSFSVCLCIVLFEWWSFDCWLSTMVASKWDFLWTKSHTNWQSIICMTHTDCQSLWFFFILNLFSNLFFIENLFSDFFNCNFIFWFF